MSEVLKKLLIILVFVTPLASSYYFHAYKSNFSVENVPAHCKKYDFVNKPRAIRNDETNKFKLWPDLANSYQLSRGEDLFGFWNAMEVIWKNQHPPDCSKAKFLVSNGYGSGFGSQVHVEGNGLTIALNTGRVYLMHPGGPERLKHFMYWQTDNSHCKSQKKRTLECYYEPWSSCTLQDALGANASHARGLPDVMLDKGAAKAPVAILYHSDTKDHSIPKVFEEMMNCSPFSKDKIYYWWRAITATYLLRPNQATITALNLLSSSIPLLSTWSSRSEQTFQQKDTIIAMYVRHGDKHVEMKLLPFQSYANAAKEIHVRKSLVNYFNSSTFLDSNTMKSNNKNIDRNESVASQYFGTIFVGTEDPDVIRDAISWGSKVNWTVSYTNLFNRVMVSARLNQQTQMKLKHGGAGLKHHDKEYLSMLLNLEISLKSDAWVCTLASNWCRIIDEMRATVGRKANFLFVDISSETCSVTPCFGGEHIVDFGWRL